MLMRAITVIFLTLCTALIANAHEQNANTSSETPSLQGLQVNGALTAPANGVTSLKFGEFYKMPVGPRGLELTPKLLSLVGKKIRIVGYMAKAEPATPGMFILSPLPVEMGDEDEKLVDDFPPNSLFVHMDESQLMLPYIEGLMNITGVLRVGSFNEPDGHVSTFQLELDSEIVRDFKRTLATNHASSSK